MTITIQGTGEIKEMSYTGLYFVSSDDPSLTIGSSASPLLIEGDIDITVPRESVSLIRGPSTSSGYMKIYDRSTDAPTAKLRFVSKDDSILTKLRQVLEAGSNLLGYWTDGFGNQEEMVLPLSLSNEYVLSDVREVYRADFLYSIEVTLIPAEFTTTTPMSRAFLIVTSGANTYEFPVDELSSQKLAETKIIERLQSGGFSILYTEMKVEDVTITLNVTDVNDVLTLKNLYSDDSTSWTLKIYNIYDVTEWSSYGVFPTAFTVGSAVGDALKVSISARVIGKTDGSAINFDTIESGSWTISASPLAGLQRDTSASSREVYTASGLVYIDESYQDTISNIRVAIAPADAETLANSVGTKVALKNGANTVASGFLNSVSIKPIPGVTNLVLVEFSVRGDKNLNSATDDNKLSACLNIYDGSTYFYIGDGIVGSSNVPVTSIPSQTSGGRIFVGIHPFSFSKKLREFTPDYDRTLYESIITDNIELTVDIYATKEVANVLSDFVDTLDRDDVYVVLFDPSGNKLKINRCYEAGNWVYIDSRELGYFLVKRVTRNRFSSGGLKVTLALVETEVV